MPYVKSNYVAKNYTEGDTSPYSTAISLYYGLDPRVKTAYKTSTILNYTIAQESSGGIIENKASQTPLKDLKIKRYLLKDY